MELQKNMLFDGRYRLLSLIGQGASAQVWKACDTHANNLVVAIKIFSDNDGLNTYGWQNFEHEFTSVYNLIHTNLLPPTGYSKSKENGVPYLILQYCNNGSASSMIGRIDEDTLLHFLHDVSAGLAYLHERNIVHRDIKPDNILLDDQCNFLVTDFGISSIGFRDHSTSGSRAYMGPERFPDAGQSEKDVIAIKASDIWSLGATAYELMTGDVPFGEMGGAFQKGGEALPPLPDTFSSEVKDMVTSCLNLNPWERPKARELQQKIEGYWANGNWKGRKQNLFNKYVIAASCAAVLLVGFFVVDFNRTKVRYYKDYVEQWGVPQGIDRVSASNKKHMHRLYRFEYKKGKLCRMTHINSYGNLIDDTESERNDRPVDMRFGYSSGGRLAKVKVFNRGGKNEYVKTYNEKMTNATFRYDDENETEKRLGARTIGYVHSLQDDEPKGQISHYLLSYSEDGYVDTLRYANSNNHRCSDQDGIYGRVYVRDNKGRVLEESYIGYDNKPKATPWGLGKKIFAYNDGNLVQVKYQTVDGKPALDAKDGVCVYEMEYDKHDNLVRAYHKSADGSLMLPRRMGFAVAVQTYDDRGNLLRAQHLGMDEQPITLEDGTSTTLTRYDKNGYVEWAAYEDVEGNRCRGSQGYAIIRLVNDDHGNQLETWYYDSDSTLVVTQDGTAGYKCEFDSLGNLTQLMNYGPDMKPTLSSTGIYGWRMKYNKFGLRSELTYLDKNEQPTMSDELISIVRYGYDDHANETSRMFYDSTGVHLTTSNYNIAGWTSQYDEYGNEIERVYIDCDSNRCVSNEGYAIIKRKYDEYGNMIQNRYYGADGRLTLVNGTAGADDTYDLRGNLTENKPVGLNEQLASGKLISRYKYDENDNIVEFALFHGNGNEATNSLGYHKYVKQYDNRNNPVEERYYNTNGRLTRYDDDNYAIVRNKYDDRGFRIERRVFDVNDHPVCCSEGWAMSRYEFDAMGNTIRQLFFDVDDSPTNPNKMVPEGICKYNAQGQMTYIAAADGHGNLIDNPKSGWSIRENKYDRRGNMTEVAFFDKNHNPVVVKGDNYSKVLYFYDLRGNQTEVQYYNLNGCYEKQLSIYNGKGNITEWRNCYMSGTLKMSAQGFAMFKVSYKKDGSTPIVIRFYDTSGRQLAYRRFDERRQEWSDYMFDF